MVQMELRIPWHVGLAATSKGSNEKKELSTGIYMGLGISHT